MPQQPNQSGVSTFAGGAIALFQALKAMMRTLIGPLSSPFNYNAAINVFKKPLHAIWNYT